MSKSISNEAVRLVVNQQRQARKIRSMHAVANKPKTENKEEGK